MSTTCTSEYAECPEGDRRCVRGGASGHEPGPHYNRAGFAWDDDEAAESAQRELTRLRELLADRDRLAAIVNGKVELDTITIYPPHERWHGRCDTCNEIRWETEANTGGRGKPRRSTHCGCCTHRHNLPNGGHDERCLADQRNCRLLHEDGSPVFNSVTYPGPH